MEDKPNYDKKFIFKVTLNGKENEINQTDQEFLEHYVPRKNKHDKLPVIFPFATLPFNLKANTLMIVSGMSLGWKIWETRATFHRWQTNTMFNRIRCTRDITKTRIKN